MPTMPLPTNDEVDDARVLAADDILTTRHGGLTDGSTPIRASITCSSCGATHSYSVLRDGTAEAHALEWCARFDRESAQRKTKRLKLRRLSFIFISDQQRMTIRTSRKSTMTESVLDMLRQDGPEADFEFDPQAEIARAKAEAHARLVCALERGVTLGGARFDRDSAQRQPEQGGK